MAIDFSQFVFQPTPLRSWNYGEAFKNVIEGNRERARLAQDESQYARTRSDTQNTNAADFASKNATAAYDTAKTKYDEQLRAINKGRMAAQSGHADTARALVPMVRALGGEARQNPDGSFFFKEGSAPQRGMPDVGAARRQMYQGAPPGTQANQPFQVPGFGPNGQRNPFAPQALPGAPAAALQGQQQAPAPPNVPDAGPPPGAAKDDPPPGIARSIAPAGAVWLPPGMDPGPQPEPAPPEQTSAEADLAALNAVESEPEPGDAAAAPQPAPQAATPDRNPLAPPAIDDIYTIDPSMVRRENAKRLDPVLKGLTAATPDRFTELLGQFTSQLSELGYSPDETLKLMQPYYEQLMAAYRGEVAAEGQAGRLALSARHQESVQEDKYRQIGIRRAKDLVSLDNLKETKRRIEATRDIDSYLDSAHRNANTADALIRKIYDMQAKGVMTDKDYEQTKGEQLKTVWQAIKDRTIEKLFNPNGGGLAPDVVSNIRELVHIAMENNARAAGSARDSLFRAWRTTQNEAERRGIADTLTASLPEEYWPEELSHAGQSENVPTYDPSRTGQFDSTEMPSEEEGGPQLDPRSYDPTDGPPPLGDDNLGVAPLPDVRGSNVPKKPPRDVKKMTNAAIHERVKQLKAKAEAK